MYCLKGESMSEAKALILLAAALLAMFGTVMVVCIDLGAGGAVLGLVLGLSCAAGGYLSSLIVVHYADKAERHKREEILLSR
jgi:hypothetical protein